MSSQFNEYGQPIGQALPDFLPARPPQPVTLEGRYCRIEPLGHAHFDQLADAFSAALHGDLWTYLPVGPFESTTQFRELLHAHAQSKDPLHMAIVDKQTGKARGTFALMRHDPRHGVIEMGWVMYSPLLKRTIAATEAQYLAMAYVFDTLGYRRYEWKCDSLNAASRRAAERLGFSHEGTFRQATVYKGRNRDTAWFSLLDSEWPAHKRAFEAWLDPAKFRDGVQLASLEQWHARLA